MCTGYVTHSVTNFDKLVATVRRCGVLVPMIRNSVRFGGMSASFPTPSGYEIEPCTEPDKKTMVIKLIRSKTHIHTQVSHSSPIEL